MGEGPPGRGRERESRGGEMRRAVGREREGKGGAIPPNENAGYGLAMKYRNAADRQTDRQTDRKTISISRVVC